MNIQGRVNDPQGQPLPAAAVYESDQVGNLTGRGTTTRIDGTFDLEVKVNRQNPGFFTIRFLGFKPLTLPITGAYHIIELQPVAFDLPPVEIRPEPAKKSWWPWLGLIGLLLFLNRKP